MDRILNKNINDFFAEYEIEKGDSGRNFECFAVHSIISNEYDREFELDDVLTTDEDNKGNDLGIDGIAIIVNGRLANSTSVIEDLLNANYKLNVTFVFIQATLQGFITGKLRDFAAGVKDFFSVAPKLKRNQLVENFSAIANFIYENSFHFERNPSCKLFYASATSWREEADHVAIIRETKQSLEDMSLFSSISFTPAGSKEVQILYRKTKSSATVTFEFKEKITLPKLRGITEAYYGLIPLSEFKKILIDENGNLRNIYYDNIRDFSGLDNPVNSQIADTLRNPNPEYFTVLNNGITVVAYKLTRIRDEFTIHDFSIVNGCQTSNVLYNFKMVNELDALSIPIRIIITDNDEVKNKITLATNNQIAVKRVQLQAVTDFQKNLENFYNSFPNDDRLYYERRDKQYLPGMAIPRSRIITMSTQIKVFGAMFLGIPDIVTSYYGRTVKEYVEGGEVKTPQIFHPDHRPLAYYVAALAYDRLMMLFRKKKFDKKYKKYTFFILTLFGKLVKAPSLNSGNKMKADRHSEKICNPIMDILNNEADTIKYFEMAILVVDKSNLELTDKENLKKSFTTKRLNETYDKLLRSGKIAELGG
jgi:hypothetical protein